MLDPQRTHSMLRRSVAAVKTVQQTPERATKAAPASWFAGLRYCRVLRFEDARPRRRSGTAAAAALRLALKRRRNSERT